MPVSCYELIYMWWVLNLILILALVVLYVVHKVCLSLNRYSAMLNAAMAKHVFTKLSPDEQTQVEQRAVQILKDGGIRNPEQRLKELSAPLKFCFFGLAMSELGYAPPVSSEKWVTVRNPFIAEGADRELWMAKNHLKNTYEIEVELDW